jgi:hypothetical protein
MSFWLDAVLTRQYLCNRLPTSTLPNNVTPFESVRNRTCPISVSGGVIATLLFLMNFALKLVLNAFGPFLLDTKNTVKAGLHGKSSGFFISLSLSSPPSPRLPRDAPRARTVAGQAHDDMVLRMMLRML